MGKNQHVTPHKEGGWQVKGENNTRATVRTDTQAKAIQRAREIARNQESELFIHGRNGRIRDDRQRNLQDTDRPALSY